MLKLFSNKPLVLLGLLIAITAASSIYLSQQFSNTLIQLMASHLLEQERDYLNTQLNDGLASKTNHDHPLTTGQPLNVTTSRSYFSLLHSPLPDLATPLKHDSSVWLFSEQSMFAIKLIARGDSNTPTWLLLDMDTAFAINDFLLLLQVINAVIVALFTSCCAWLLYRFHLSQRQLKSTLKREQAFANDVSHELRTPLTIVQNALNCEDSTLITNDRLNLAKQACTSMVEQLNVLLALARNKHHGGEKLLLLPQLEKAMFTLYLSEPEFISQIELEVSEDASITGHPQLIQLLLLNILGNACYHSGGNILHINAQFGLLRFSNKVTVKPINIKRKNMLHQGFGHGIHLMKRITDVLNWTLVINQNAEEYEVKLYHNKFS
ncbi:histidine kinase dimerization/phospho-acceptor domain-containing protein [Pseudoalteromonas 'SMAR']|uniref:histidine kinase dimerization/phospho-acceptor domain-containing protein n=1 Tax=Pseudoalteromonas 'SMAR' TaxID=3416908 RepID=UPI003AF1F6A1